MRPLPSAVRVGDAFARAMGEDACGGGSELGMDLPQRDPREVLESSRRELSRLLHAAVIERGAAAELPPGPHDQPLLRDVGTLEMLLFHDRALRAPA